MQQPIKHGINLFQWLHFNLRRDVAFSSKLQRLLQVLARANKGTKRVFYCDTFVMYDLIPVMSSRGCQRIFTKWAGQDNTLGDEICTLSLEKSMGGTSMKVLIVGAGFGGLALATSLQRDGHAVTLIEKGYDHKPVGFVIGLWGNGIHTLEPFGVVERVRRVSIPVTKEVIRNKSCIIIARMDYRPLIERWGSVFLLLHSDLQEILRDLVSGIPLHFGTTVCSLQEQEGGVFATLSSGTQEKFDLVVGADGVHSQVRTLLFGNTGVEPSGLRLWLTLLPGNTQGIDMPNDLFGEGEYIGLFPTRTQQLGALFLATLQAGETTLQPADTIAYLRTRFRDFGWVIPDLLQSLHDPAENFSFAINQISLETWYRGHVVLLGDASSPFFFSFTRNDSHS